MSARKGITRCGRLGVTGGFDQLRANPWPVSAHRQLNQAVYKLCDPPRGNKAIAPFFVHAPKNDKRQERHDIHRKFGQRIKKFIQDASRCHP